MIAKTTDRGFDLGSRHARGIGLQGGGARAQRDIDVADAIDFAKCALHAAGAAAAGHAMDIKFEGLHGEFFLN